MNRWKVFLDGVPIHNPFDEHKRIQNPSLSMEVNKASSFSFEMRPDHPYYAAVQKMASVIEVYYGSRLYFSGRALNDETGFYNERTISCESELAYLNDSIQRPFIFPEDEETTDTTPEDYLRFLIARHNAQVPEGRKFTVGVVTVTDPNDYIRRSDTEYSTTWTLINEGLLDTLGGYLRVRHSGSTMILDYLAAFEEEGQGATFGVNLINIMTARRGEDVATAILPLGAKDEETDERLTISSIADQSDSQHTKKGDIVYSPTAEEIYGGRILKVVKWDDVTQAVNLYRKAKAELQNVITEKVSTKLTAADLSGAGVETAVPFFAGMLMKAKSPPHEGEHNFSGYLLVTAATVPLFRPQDIRITVGVESASLTAASRATIRNTVKTIYNDVSLGEARAISTAVSEASSLITQSEDAIRTEVSQTYTTQSAFKKETEDIRSKLTQTANSITADFSILNQTVSALQSTALNQSQLDQLTEIIGYIKAGDLGDNIIGLEIGQTNTTGSTVTYKKYARLTSEALIFYDASGVEAARFADGGMTTDSATIKTRLTLAGYTIDTDDGGWAFRWVGVNE